MAGTRGGLGRIVAMGVALAVALLLLAAGEARAGSYRVAQCGWYVGADADWADTTGGAKFRQDAYCVGPPGSDAFAGIHMKSFTRADQSTVSGTRFARWRWNAPAGASISQVRGTWFHTLHDGMEQRIGGINWGGGFEPFAAAATTDVTPREFSRGFSPAVAAIEDRLLCARGEDKWCVLDPASWSAIRALTITVEDGRTPSAWVGGDLLAGGWRRGVQGVGFAAGNEEGGGLYFGETFLDGARIDRTDFACQTAFIDGEFRGTRMQPCPTSASGGTSVDTRRLSDGNHTLRHCVTDFGGNVGCSDEHTFGVDNNPPAAPRGLTVAGGEGWRRIDDFDLSWANPDQGAASPIWGAYWRVTGPAGYDSGVHLVPGRDVAALADRNVPRPGVYTLQLWLRDEAGNDAPGTAVALALRYDDVPPGLAFAVQEGDGVPEQVRADVSDAHSGPAQGTIFYRRLNVEQWTELPTRLQAGDGAGKASLIARVPELAPGTYVFRAEASDGAGNRAATSLRADGTEMAIRKTPPPVAPQRAVEGQQRAAAKPAAPAPRTKTRLFARLRGGHGRGDSLTIPFSAPALISGRLTRADGAGLAGREVRVVARPSRGALAPVSTVTATTGEHGGFQLRVAAGPSRRLAVRFPGDDGLEPATRPSLELRVRAGVSLRAAPLSLRTGQAVRLSGRVRGRGAAMPRRGKLVAIQYLEAATHRWRPVLVTRSDHVGRFHARYRFRYVEGTAAIQLRATALAEERWPYAPGSSRPLTVRVHGR
ncbi:MAG TPA: carboxypeptidase-like regulatory domain-containing protein [Solirubrobacterales bacterium]|nr:carboxypeptidase-like regulatory domain-containing protein [Solirubrobacterales bacterium]